MGTPHEDTNDLLLTSPLAAELEDAADAGTEDVVTYRAGMRVVLPRGELDLATPVPGERAPELTVTPTPALAKLLAFDPHAARALGARRKHDRAQAIRDMSELRDQAAGLDAPTPWEPTGDVDLERDIPPGAMPPTGCALVELLAYLYDDRECVRECVGDLQESLHALKHAQTYDDLGRAVQGLLLAATTLAPRAESIARQYMKARGGVA